MKGIYIIGASGFGREVADTIRSINAEEIKNGRDAPWDIAGFIDDDEAKWGMKINDIPVLGGTAHLKEIAGSTEIGVVNAVIAIAAPEVKKELVTAMAKFTEWPNLIHPTANVSKYSSIGKGNVLQPFVYVGPNARINDYCHVNVRSNLGHDCTVGNYASVMCLCDITGNVELGEGVYVGSSVSILPGVKVGKYATLGMGAAVFKNVDAANTVIGNPSKRIQ